MVPINEIIIAVITAIILTPLSLFIKSLVSRVRKLDDKLEAYKKETDVEFNNIKKEVREKYYRKEDFEKKRELINTQIKDLREEIKEEMKNFRQDIKEDIKSFRVDIKDNHTALMKILIETTKP